MFVYTHGGSFWWLHGFWGPEPCCTPKALPRDRHPNLPVDIRGPCVLPTISEAILHMHPHTWKYEIFFGNTHITTGVIYIYISTSQWASAWAHPTKCAHVLGEMYTSSPTSLVTRKIVWCVSMRPNYETHSMSCQCCLCMIVLYIIISMQWNM